jgi:hypothetical protein
MTAPQRGLHQDDIVLLGRIARFGLQRNGLADEIGKHGQRLRLFVEEQIDDIGAGQDAVFAGIELARFAQQFAQDFVGDGARRLDLAAPAAGRAGFRTGYGPAIRGSACASFRPGLAP